MENLTSDVMSLICKIILIQKVIQINFKMQITIDLDTILKYATWTSFKTDDEDNVFSRFSTKTEQKIEGGWY